MLVELKNGETLNGHLVNCDTWMNLTLKEVVQTSPVRSSRHHTPSWTRPMVSILISSDRMATSSFDYPKSTCEGTTCVADWFAPLRKTRG